MGGRKLSRLEFYLIFYLFFSPDFIPTWIIRGCTKEIGGAAKHLEANLDVMCQRLQAMDCWPSETHSCAGAVAARKRISLGWDLAQLQTRPSLDAPGLVVCVCDAKNFCGSSVYLFLSVAGSPNLLTRLYVCQPPSPPPFVLWVNSPALL